MSHPPPGPLDPDARVVIDRLNALNAPGYETMPPKAARTIAAHLRRNAAWPRVKVGSIRDVDLLTAAGSMRVRHYRPLLRETPSPALVYLHGGGWVLGDLDTMDHLCRSLVRQAGVDVISLDYPLSPESRCSGTVASCAAALTAIYEQAQALGIDPQRIALGGDSAGGNLAAVLAIMGRNGDVPRVRAQCLIYPVLDLRRTDTSSAAKATMFMKPETIAWFTENYLGPEGAATDWRASPLLAQDLSGLPPGLVMTAGHDVLRDQGLDYAARLKAAGVPVVARDFPGQIHNFVAMPYAIPTAHVAIAEIAEFLLDQVGAAPGV